MFKKITGFIKEISPKKDFLYIHSNDLLPPPLPIEEERRLVKMYEEGDLEAKDKLIVHNLRLVVYIAKRFESKKTTLEDLISIGSMGLMKGVKTFKSEKNIKLATYASRCIENEILMFLRKISRIRNELSLDEQLNVDVEGNELYLSDVLFDKTKKIDEIIVEDERQRVMYEVIETLNEREKEIIVMRFGLYNTIAQTQKEVADLLNISQSYISRLEKKIIDKIKIDMEKKLQA